MYSFIFAFLALFALFQFFLLSQYLSVIEFLWFDNAENALHACLNRRRQILILIQNAAHT